MIIVLVSDKHISEVNIIFKGLLGLKSNGKYEGMNLKWRVYGTTIALNLSICRQ